MKPEEVEQRIIDQHRTEVVAIIRQAKAKALERPCGSADRYKLMKWAETINRELEWPLPRTVTFVSDSHTGMHMLGEVKVVTRLSGAPLEITAQQEEKVQEIEEKHQGAIPLTEDEWSAFEDGDPQRLADLAKRPGSGLHHFFWWDEKTVAELDQFRRMHGSEN